MFASLKSQSLSKEFPKSMRVEFGGFTFDTDTRELLDGAQRVHVSPKGFEVLQLLLERRPGVVPKAELLERVWPGAFVGDASLSVAIAELRNVLRDDSREAHLIRTVHRVGYAFCGDAREVGSLVSRGAMPYSRCWLRWNDRTFQLWPGENLIGRDPRSAIWIDVSGVSRRHALLVVEGDAVTIEDVGSSNGTFVGGRKLSSRHRLADRDEIEVGAATLQFRIWSDQESPKTERIARRKA
jgi:DNA-binding winged helix-turn-helix (wHTH) protein